MEGVAYVTEALDGGEENKSIGFAMDFNCNTSRRAWILVLEGRTTGVRKSGT